MKLNGRRITNKQIADIYAKKGCNVMATCTALNMSRSTFYKWRDKYPKLKEMLEEAEESIIDFAESKLVEHINDGDTTALIFFLKTKGKKRGYVEQIEQNVTVNPFEALMKSLPDE